MRLPVDTRVQLLCPIAPQFRRCRRHFKPFSSPQAVTQDRVRLTDSASSAVLSTADSRHTTNVRPLQEQLRDQMDLHKLQREPVPEDTSDGESPSEKIVDRDGKLGKRDGTKAKQAPARKRDTSRRRNKQLSNTQSGQPKTVAKKAARAARSGRAQFSSQQPEEQTTEPKHQQTLTKQEDVALCSAIQASTYLLHTLATAVCSDHKRVMLKNTATPAARGPCMRPLHAHAARPCYVKPCAVCAEPLLS